MSIYEFMSDSPFLSFFLAYIMYKLFAVILTYAISRPLRAMNIRKHGWPPAHCDADGDFKQEEVRGESDD